ncbi:MAG: hypothetical protein A3J38_06860 [Gammaproteobacteria bacterium RIFCSPHIGHO2_12_FULL_45_9]|nr:MAG: hypothetical protein A3J38_06860 [Gammaproteobacteria bacterium RIFCSPHIGHO2_12_FULL_45_9]
MIPQTPDSYIREQALDPTHSFIVQAPAGSGKTELLTQRLLTLLTQVSQPEQIIAITFTRKAASEMQDRLLRALQTAQSAPRPTTPHAQKTYDLATAVLAQDHAHHWQLLHSPHRLRVLTFDALAGELAQTQPIEAGLGLGMRVTEDPEPLYQAAFTALLAYVNQPEHPAYPHLKTLLLHLQNDAEKLNRLLMPLLEKRDIWLTHLMPYHGAADALRIQLETTLCTTIEDTLIKLYHTLPATLHAPLLAGLVFAANNEHHIENLSVFSHYTATTLPEPTLDYLLHYQILAKMVLTETHQVRKMVDKRCGFPPTAKAEKKAWLDVLQALTDYPECLQQLIQTRLLPQPTYDDETFALVAALLIGLPWLVAELRVVFDAYHEVDFLEMALAALRALGTLETPSDLALQLDRHIQHILVDEFQDTSHGQITLLERLTEGWQIGDGRTLFIVGDPMQSIYRFRNADVGLFLKAQTEGIGPVKLTPLTLSANFRSNATLLTWINHTFAPLFPRAQHMALGAIPFHAAVAMHPFVETAIHITPCHHAEEAARILIERIHTLPPTDTIAILARSREHFTPFVAALKTANIPYHAVDLDPLADCPEIRDVSSLVSVLRNPNDRIAWLALLRSPLCGLSLDSLLRLTEHTPLSLEQAMLHITLPHENEQARLSHVVHAIQAGLAQLRLHPLCLVAEHTWKTLGGEYTLQTPEQQQHLEDFWQLLYSIPSDAPPDTWKRRLQKLKARAIMTPEVRVSLMTIHKSKGLEFDHVFLPELHRIPRSDTQPILLMHDTLLAPLPDFKEKTLYHWLWAQEQERRQLETTRLLYVAATRARETLHCLFTGVQPESDAPTRSFLQLLGTVWPRAQWTLPPTPATEAITEPSAEPSESVAWRLCTNKLSSVMPIHHPDAASLKQGNDIMWHKVCYSAELGTILHACLARYTTTNQLPTETYVTQHALQLGVPRAERISLWQQLQTMWARVMSDARAHWILHPHPHHQSEYALSAIENGKPVHIILDRTFETHNVRWIIDYKTSQAPLQTLYETYYTQLERYATLWIQAYPQDTVRVGLYNVTTTEWLEWAPVCQQIYQKN